MSFVSKEIRRFGYIVVNDVQVLAAQYHFECDSASDLPTQAQFQNDKNVFLFMGSTAHTIDADALYKMDSSGAWVQQSQPWQPLADYSVLSNKPQINGHTLTGNQSGADFGLQNVLTFDNTPTQDSTNPVTSGGIWTDQQRQETEIGVVANAGAKNSLKFDAIGSTTYGTTYEISGVKFTLNADKTVTFERISTSSSNANCLLILNGARLDVSSYCDGNHILSGCPSGGGSSSYEMMVTISGGAYTKRDYGTGVILDSVSGIAPYVQLTVRSGFTGTATFKPMIRPAEITDPTFQPYAPTNRELYEMILALQ